MKTLLSLFDYSGNWSRPFFENGWNVIQWDIKLDEFMDIMAFSDAEISLEILEDVHAIIAAPPCTDFTNSGAQYWAKKDRDGRTAISLEYVHQVIRLANLFEPTDEDYDDTFFWVLENPVGRLPKLVPILNDYDGGRPYYFHPYEFAGYLDLNPAICTQLDLIREKAGIGLSDYEVNLILQSNVYTKKTGLWGNFNRDIIKKPIEPVRASKQGTFTQRYGGKSDRTKELRSNTPKGFARAFYEANKDFKCYQ